MFYDDIHEAVYHALINQSRVFMNTLRNMVKGAMSGSLMQGQTTGPAYFHTSPLATGTGKQPMEIPETSNAPKVASMPQFSV